jgi:hypothetical protein
VAVIQGWVSYPPTREHLKLRNNVIERQLERKKFVVAVDSNLFLYANTDNPLHYLRYSFNGVFPNTGIYCDIEINPSRWIKISRDLNIHLKDYRSTGDHILLLLQRNGGWSMGQTNVVDWAAEVIVELRKHTDRKIVIRAHPGDKAAKYYLGDLTSLKEMNVHMSPIGKPLLEDLANCWAAINYNSSPVVGALIEGIPIFVLNPEKSQCAEVANTDLSLIENPKMFDRERWVQRISMFHWNFDELASGECWDHMRRFTN